MVAKIRAHKIEVEDFCHNSRFPQSLTDGPAPPMLREPEKPQSTAHAVCKGPRVAHRGRATFAAPKCREAG